MSSNLILPGYQPMNRIIDRIYIGCYDSAKMLDYTNRAAIDDVLNCTPIPHEGLDKFRVNQLNLNDGEEIPAEVVFFAIRCIDDAVRNGRRILVHCLAGISRSTGLVCGYLMYNGFSWDEALKVVRRGRPQAMPHPKIELSIKKALGLAIDPTTSVFGVQHDSINK